MQEWLGLAYLAGKTPVLKDPHGLVPRSPDAGSDIGEQVTVGHMLLLAEVRREQRLLQRVFAPLLIGPVQQLMHDGR